MTCALVIAVLLVQTPAVYRNDAYGFQIVTLAGWKQVPDSILQSRVAAMRRHGAIETETNYLTAFVPAAATDWFAHPYVLVQFNEFAGEDSGPSLEELAPSLEELGQQLSISQAQARYDPIQEAVLVSGQRVDVAQGVAIRSYSGIKQSRRGLVSVMVYAREVDSTDTAAIRDRFLAALHIVSRP